MSVSVPPPIATASHPFRHRPATLLLCSLVLAPFRLLALPEYPGIGDSLIYQFNGLVVVFLALGMIWVMMEVMGAIFRRVAARQASRVVPPPAGVLAPPAPDPVVGSAEALDPATYAVVAAAVYATLGTGFRIVKVMPSPDAQDWSREGRRDHFRSHRVR